MAFDNDDRRYPGYLETAAGLIQLDENVRQMAGVGSGQTDLVIEAPVSFEEYIESTHATHFDQVKDLKDNGAGGAATRYEFEYESQAATGDTGPFYNRLIAAIERIGIGSRQELGQIAFLRPESGVWFLKLLSVVLGEESASVVIRDGLTELGENRGFVGINTEEPEYELDVPAGTINVSGDYLSSGAVLSDWTNVAGTATWTGPARVTSQMETTLATGTPPIAATSTTEAIGLSADNFQGETWHPGVIASGFDTYAAADTLVAAGNVTRIGEWNITATFAVHLDPADAGKTINCKLKDGGGTQIGDTFPFEADPASSGLGVCPAKVVGTYTSAAGNEAIRAYVAVPTGTGSSAEVVITMTWQRP
jgi:hypothetical protein